MTPSIVTANLLRSPSDPHARVFDSLGILRKYIIGTRAATPGIRPERQQLLPQFGLANFLVARSLSMYRGECFRFALSPWFERSVRSGFRPGDSLFAGLGYLNGCMQDVKQWGGTTMLDARNSHPSNFWSLIAEEHARWECNLPPISPEHHMRQQRSVALADWVFAPSRFVADSFTARGFPADRVIRLPYPVDLGLFHPAPAARPADRPLTVCSSGLLTLRKGSPYLFEAFRLIRKEVPDARLKLIDSMADSFRMIYQRHGFNQLPVDWSPGMPHRELVTWLQNADVFLLPTIEEGMVRSAAEAMGCGLPVVTTRNAGVDDLIEEGVNGSIVPIRDPEACARAVLEWWEKIRSGSYDPRANTLNRSAIGTEAFAANLTSRLQQIWPDATFGNDSRDPA